MLDSQQLEDLLHVPGVSNQTRCLYCLALGDLKPKPLSRIREIGVGAGWRGITKLNVSMYLGRAKGLAISKPEGWQLTGAGASYVHTQANLPKQAVATALTASLRKHLAQLASADTRMFVEEGIEAIERGLYRSAVVLTWVGAVSVLYAHIEKNKLNDFNAEAARRFKDWKVAKNADGLARMKETDFLDAITAIGVLGKNVKTELVGCLNLRNGCGHPNSLKLAEAKVAAHVETLVLNVFEKF